MVLQEKCLKADSQPLEAAKPWLLFQLLLDAPFQEQEEDLAIPN